MRDVQALAHTSEEHFPGGSDSEIQSRSFRFAGIARPDRGPSWGGRMSAIYQFGPFQLDAQQKVLLREGQLVGLSPKAVETLLALVERRGRIVSREELNSAVWPDTFVEYSNLAHQIAVIRKALGESADGAKYVQTLARRGYRFVGEVSATPEAPSAGTVREEPPRPVLPEAGVAGERTSQLWPWAAGILVVTAALALYVLLQGRSRASTAPAAIRSVAVLPLSNLSGDAAQDYFADGITESLITELAQLRTVLVVSPSSSMQYRGSQKTIPEIGRELHVDAVLQGAVMRSADRVRVTVRLVSTQNQAEIWGEQYDRNLGDVLALESELARSMADQVAVRLAPSRPAHTRRIDPAAQDSYLKGRFAWNRRTEDSYFEAIRFFNDALAREPSYAQAYAGLADAYALLGSVSTTRLSRGESMEKARAAAQRAIALDPSLAEAHTSLAFVLMHYDYKFTAADKEFRLALQMNPNYATAHQWYAYDLMAMGRTAEALQENERAQQLDPLSLIIATDRGELMEYARRFDEAKRQFQEVAELDPNFLLPHQYLAMLFADTGDKLRAEQESKRALALSNHGVLAELTAIYVTGKTGAPERALAELRQREPEVRRADASYGLAAEYAVLGQRAHVFQCLQWALEHREGSLIMLRVDPRFDAVRSDPRFDQISQKVGLPAGTSYPSH